ncbi:MAG: tetratricopeptide repeat protein [Bacteroidales bacterium]|nr:tetratricopeptide repeat protein [Bacteroidales bacterium]
MKKLLLPLCLLASEAGNAVFGQVSYSSQLPEALFIKGKEMYEGRNWNGCVDQLTRFKKETKNTDLFQESDFMIASSAFEQGKEYSLKLLKEFKANYPWSRHIKEVDFLIGSYYFLNEDYLQAIDWFEGIEIGELPFDKEPDFFQRLGISYLKIKNIDAAKPLFTVLSNIDSKYNESARYYLSYIKYTEGDYKGAYEGFDSLPSNGEYAQSVPYYMAQIYFIQKDWNQALRLDLELLDKNPSPEQDAELNRIAGECYFEQDMPQKSISYLKKYVSQTDAPLRTTCYKLGTMLYKNGDAKSAIDYLSKVPSGSDALSQNAYLHLGHCYVQIGDLKNAKMAFSSASSTDFDLKVKEAAMYNYALAVHEGSYAAFNESVDVFENFLNTFPNSQYSDKVNDCLVEVYMTTRNYEAALKSINKISRPGQKILEAKQRILFQLGTQYVANTELDKASKYFTDAIALGNINAEIKAKSYFWRGECEYRNEDYRTAESDYKQFLNSSPNTSDETYALGKYNLAYAYFKQNQFSNAVNYFESYVNMPSERGKNTHADALNRIGDCYFYNRQFAKAEDYYSQASSISPAAGDYAIFQKAFMAGLQKNYSGKIQTLDKLLSSYPQSDYVDDALLEKGKTYVMLNNNNMAIASFTKLVNEYPHTAAARQAGAQLGLIYFNENRLDESIAAYKNVISNYPGSEEARTAAEDLKAVYIEKNDIPAYSAYINSLQGKVQFAAGEEDSLTYLAAEKVIVRGNKAEIEKTLINYLQSFENGAFRLNANTELARIYFADKDYARALQCYGAILQNADNKFTEEALARTAEIYFIDGESEKALESFKELALKAERADNKLAAKLGILRTSSVLGKNDDVIAAAGDLLNNENLSPEIKNEALYNRSKTLLLMNKKDAAVKDLLVLSKDTRNIFGAEAKYLLAQTYFDEGNSDKAEKVVFEQIDSATPHQYWLARCFILLSDIYIAKNDSFQAKQYLQNLENNYKGDDDIESMIKERYSKIEK